MKLQALVLVALAMLLEGAAGQSDAEQYLNSHNSVRQAVEAGIPDLSWSDQLEDYATAWATDRANTADCTLSHSDGPYGENLYWSSASSEPADAVNKWVDEKQYYDYDSNSCADGHVCGHYTQVVWRDTQLLGCGSANCPGGGTFVVCSYDPPGNVNGQKPYLLTASPGQGRREEALPQKDQEAQIGPHVLSSSFKGSSCPDLAHILQKWLMIIANLC